MKRMSVSLGALFVSMLLLAPIAQADELSELKERFGAMEKEMKTMAIRIEELEERRPSVPLVDEKPLFEEVTGIPLEWHGVANMTYSDEEANGLFGGEPSFQLNTIHLSLLAEISEPISLFTDFEFEDGQTLKSERIEMRWRYLEHHSVIFGKFISPIGVEGELHYASIRKFSSRPFISREIIPGTWPDVGIQLKGEFPLPLADMKLKYHGIYMNGLKGPARSDRQVTDNNKDKMIGGRLGLVPIEGLEAGGYYAASEYDNDRQVELPFLGAYLIYERGNLDIRGEYIDSDVEHVSDIDLERDGFYLQAAYKLFKKSKYLNYLEPKIRFDKIVLGKFNNTDRYRWATGVNLSPYEHFLFKIEYQWIKSTNPPDLADDSFLFEVVMDF